MKVYTFSEARQNFASVLESAQKDGAVRITRRDGRAFTIQPAPEAPSPLAIKAVALKIAYFTDAGPRFHRKAGQHFTHAGPVVINAARR